MRELIFVSLLVLLIGTSFSTLYNSTYDLLTNCTTAANKNIKNIDYHTWVDCLNRTSFVLNGSCGYGSKGILFLRGYGTYKYEVYNGSNKIYSNTTKQVVYILPNGTYTVKISESGYIPKNMKFELDPGDFNFTYIELEKNTTTQNQTQGGGGGGLPTNTFVNISNDYVKQELDSLKDVLGLSNEEVEYQKKVLDYVNVQTKYFLFATESSNTLYYYIYNNWNKSVNVTIVVDIPKEISQNMSGISLKSGYKIIKSDPIVSWNLNVGSGKSAYVEYTVMKNITTVVPPVLLFHGIELPKKPQNNQSNQTINNNTQTNQMNQTNQINQTNQTAPKIKKEKKKFNMNIVWIIVGVIIGSLGVFIYFYFFRRRKPHEIVEKSLNQIERFTG